MTRATAVRVGWECTPLTVTDASRAPRYSPTRKPPKDSTWTMAPSRSPWMAASHHHGHHHEVDEVHRRIRQEVSGPWDGEYSERQHQ